MINKILSCLVLALLFSSKLISQEQALAYPVTNITIDGSFKDWPELINWYCITHNYNNDELSNEDYAAKFSVAYDTSEKAVYVAVQVIDDEFVGNNDQSHTNQDHMLLYIDAIHERNGGSPVFFVASDEVLEVHHKPGSIDSRNHFIQLNNAQSARKRLKNTTQYEWKIVLNDHIKPNAVFGLDFMLIDMDQEDQNQTYALWKDGFGKSNGSQRLGDLVLMPPNQKVGKVEGFINVKSINEPIHLNSIDIVSVQDQKFWIKTEVDSNGYFQAFLPSGKYQIEPNRHYTSHVYSAGFSQNTRKIHYSKTNAFYISNDKTAVLDTVQISLIPRPVVKKQINRGLPIEYLSKKDIDDFVKTWQSYLGIPAVSVAVIRDNKVFYDQTIGIKSTMTNEKVNDQTLFEAASITNSVFGIMVLRLAERGIIDLDKPLHEYLPFPNIEKDERAKLLTARIILGHQSGLPNWAWGGPGGWKEGGEISLNFEPGTAFGYSGEGFNYLGRVVEHITKKSLVTLFEEEVKKPFGLNDSYMYFTEDLQDRIAVGHVQQYFQVKQKDEIASPASSLQTNAHLFKDFVLGIMNEKGLSAESYNLIYQPHKILKPDEKIFDPEIDQHVSHGFFVQTTDQGKLLAHGGNNGDYDSKFAYSPDKKFAYVVFTNSNLGDEFIRALEVFLLRP